MAASAASSSSSLRSRLLHSTTTTSIFSFLNSGDLSGALSAAAAAAAPLPSTALLRLLLLCSHRRSLPSALTATSLLPLSPSPSSTFLLNRAIETLALCGGLAHARALFDEMPRRDGGSWNALLAAHARAARPADALALFARMRSSGISPKGVTFASALSCCADLSDLSFAAQLHGLLLKLGFGCNIILCTALVDVYGKCRVVDDARKAFESMPSPNPVSWNVIIRRYLEVGRGDDAILMFFRMIQTGAVVPLNFTVSNALLACSDQSALIEGSLIHGMVVKIGYDHDALVRNSIVEMYAKCGALRDARRLFDVSGGKDVVLWTSIVSGYVSRGRISEAEELFEQMPERNVVSWNAMFAGYAQWSSWEKVFYLFHRMRKETEEIDLVTLGLILNACANLFDLEKGRQVHGFAYRRGFSFDLFFSNALLGMYAKCGRLRSAEILFSKLGPNRDRVSWNSLISGYERHCRSEEALNALTVMQSEACPNNSTFSSALAACANIFVLDQGKQIHGNMIRNGFEIDDIVRAALVDMYSKCRLIDYSIRVFKERRSEDVVVWNSMILGCAHNARGEYGLELFEEMRGHGIKADNVTFVGALLACISEGYVNLGQTYFNLMSEEYGIIPRIEHYKCMIELFGKHGFMVELEEFVERMPFEPTIAMWTRIFDSCREYGNRRLGERAARCINESNPLNPVRFEVLNSESDLALRESMDCT
ncbi:pentatricopeptide repeat-containing protein At3g26540 [Ananas comosus]|uniref:Pentatricopeptide repeat-containing protein At3g26540 n=1 Tax=Ananas comosus TaxID=4615 RepID=A0A6P5GUF2_ANACO|nr:pentatricopeptide repeat-containing protein At3g26540 [Ananas comosus]